MKKDVQIFSFAIAFRILMLLIASLIITFITPYHKELSTNDLLNHITKWDSHHYINIAENGYKKAVEHCDTCHAAAIERGIPAEKLENGEHLFLVFFPLYPYMMSIFNHIFNNMALTGLLISILCYSLGCVYIHKLILLDYDEDIANLTLILLSVFPFSFFFGGIMTEGLFLFVSGAALYHIRKNEWWRAIIFVALASATRMQGVLLGIPALAELCIQYKPIQLCRDKSFDKLKVFIMRLFSFILMLSGTAFYLLTNYLVDGYPFAFTVYQDKHWGQRLTNPLKVFEMLRDNAFYNNIDLLQRISMWYPQLIIMLITVLLLFLSFKKAKIRLSYSLYFLAYFWLTFSASNLLSAGRYTTCCIPLFLVLAILLSKREMIKSLTLITFFSLYMIYCTGYFQNMYIM